MKNKAEVIRKTGRFDNVDSAVIVSRVTQSKSESFVLIFGQSCLHCYDDSRIYAVETSSFKNYGSFFLLKLLSSHDPYSLFLQLFSWAFHCSF